MTDKIELKAEKRNEVGSKKAHTLRENGQIPAVLYGKGFEPLALKLDYIDFQTVYKKAGSSTMINLDLEGESHPAIIQDVTLEPVRNKFLHADLYKVRLDQKIIARIPLIYVGESPAVKDLGGVFVRNINELEVEAFPQDLVSQVEVDISKLSAIGDSILIKDIMVSNKVEILDDPEEIIASVVEAREEEEEVPTETSVEDVEVIKKEKEEEEEAETAAE